MSNKEQMEEGNGDVLLVRVTKLCVLHGHTYIRCEGRTQQFEAEAPAESKGLSKVTKRLSAYQVVACLTCSLDVQLIRSQLQFPRFTFTYTDTSLLLGLFGRLVSG